MRPRRRPEDRTRPVVQQDRINDQIRALLAEAEAKFDAADRAQANGNSVGWARLMEQGRELINEAFSLADARDS